MRSGFVALAIFMALLTGAAASDKTPLESALDAQYEACVDKTPSTSGMMSCAADAEAAWDKELNSAYRDLVRALKGPTLEALKHAQRAWLAQRDKEFELQGAIRGELDGTMWGPMLADQRVTLIKQRAQQLRAYKSFIDEGRP